MDFICPVCSKKLERLGACCKCENNHSYDVARQGYVNLLMSQKSAGKHHGDDKLMVTARRAFLDKGYYRPLLDALIDCVKEHCGEKTQILDAGCGEGWYCASICRELKELGLEVRAAGIDISKAALIAFSKRSADIPLAVASVFAIPAASGSADIVTSVFAPLAAEEFRRVLRLGGVLIRVIPLEKHLLELKRIVYDTPYENDVESSELEGFELLKRVEIRNDILIDNNADIKNLFAMTPYYYKTSAADQAKLKDVRMLKVRTEFGIMVYKSI